MFDPLSQGAGGYIPGWYQPDSSSPSAQQRADMEIMRQEISALKDRIAALEKQLSTSEEVRP